MPPKKQTRKQKNPTQKTEEELLTTELQKSAIKTGKTRGRAAQESKNHSPDGEKRLLSKLKDVGEIKERPKVPRLSQEDDVSKHDQSREESKDESSRNKMPTRSQRRTNTRDKSLDEKPKPKKSEAGQKRGKSRKQTDDAEKPKPVAKKSTDQPTSPTPATKNAHAISHEADDEGEANEDHEDSRHSDVKVSITSGKQTANQLKIKMSGDQHSKTIKPSHNSEDENELNSLCIRDSIQNFDLVPPTPDASNFFPDNQPFLQQEVDVVPEPLPHQDEPEIQQSSDQLMESSIHNDTPQRMSVAELIDTTTIIKEEGKMTSKKQYGRTTSKKSQSKGLTDQELDEAMHADTIQIDEIIQQIEPVVHEEMPLSQKHTIAPIAVPQDSMEVKSIEDPQIPANPIFEQDKPENTAVDGLNLEVPSVPVEKYLKSKPRKSEAVPPAKLNEEEIKEKYAENEEYQEWSRRVNKFKVDLDRGLKKGLPKIFYFEDEATTIANDHTRIQKIRDFISDAYQNFKVQNVEPSGEDNNDLDFSSFFEDQEVRRAFFKLIAFNVEGSSMNLKTLRNSCCHQIISEHFPDLSQCLTDFHIEELLTSFALRKSYGVKPKNAIIYSDTSPIALWCWDIQDHQLLDPVTENQLKKARSQRILVGKKLQTLQTLIDSCSDYTTFDSQEKISKLSQEFENYNKLSARENSSEWVVRKRKHNEVEPSSVDTLKSGQHSESKSSAVNSKSARVGQKKLKYNNDQEDAEWHQQNADASEQPLLNEQSDASIAVFKKPVALAKEQPPAQVVPSGTMLMTSFFKKVDKVGENPSTFTLRSKEETARNPYIQFGSTCETEAMKVRKEIIASHLEWSVFDNASIINKFKLLKKRDFEHHDQARLERQPTGLQEKPTHRLKHISIYNSGMPYNGRLFDKKSRIISCIKPFQRDPTIVDYDMDSEEEWEEMNADNLENDEMLVEEEILEVEEDEAELLNMPNAGVSNSIKQKLAFRSQYCFSTQQYKEDDPELRQEGFIVADDYFSQDSSIIEGNDDSYQQYDLSRKELLLKQREKLENKIRQGINIKPYILRDTQYDLGDYKAVCLMKKKQLKPKSIRISFSGATTADESAPDFPISLLKVTKVEPGKLEVKDVIDQLIDIGHGASSTKKQLLDLYKKEFPDLKKTHIEVFVKECFEKQKRTNDSKMKLYARPDAVDKYGGSSDLVLNMPLILEKKYEEERLKQQQEQPEAPKQPSEEPQPPKQQSRQRQSTVSKIGGLASSKKSTARKPVEQRQSDIHQISPAQPLLKELQEEIIEETIEVVHQSTANDHTNHDVEMHADFSEELHNGGDDNSWMDVQGAAIVTPAFNSKLYEIPPEDSNHEEDGFNLEELQRNQSISNPSLSHNHSQLYMEEQQMSLSQHAVVQYKETDDQQNVEIAESSFNRSNQQHHSTPIHNFRTLRSRDISLKNSQNNIEDERPRSDSMETDRGNPMQVFSNLDIHLDNIEKGDFEGGDVTVANMKDSFDSPRAMQQVVTLYEESKGEPLLQTEVAYSRRLSQVSEAPFTPPRSGFGTKQRVARNSALRGASEGMQSVRRSKRLESKHKALQIQNDANYQDDDELNNAYSQQSKQ